MRTLTRPAKWVAACAAAAVLLTGCGVGQSEQQKQQEVDDEGAGASADTNEDGSTDDADPADEAPASNGAGVENRSDGVLVEYTDAPDPGSPDDKLTVGIQSLTVEGETMVLRMALTPDFASLSNSEAMSVSQLDEQILNVGVALIDRENLKEYSMIRDSAHKWASDASLTTTVNGEPAHVFIVFAAPEDDIDVVDVRVNANWPVFTDVPITR